MDSFLKIFAHLRFCLLTLGMPDGEVEVIFRVKNKHNANKLLGWLSAEWHQRLGDKAEGFCYGIKFKIESM